MKFVLTAAAVPRNSGWFRLNRLRALKLAGSGYVSPLLSPCCSASVSLHLFPLLPSGRVGNTETTQSRAHMNVFSVAGRGGVLFGKRHGTSGNWSPELIVESCGNSEIGRTDVNTGLAQV